MLRIKTRYIFGGKFRQRNRSFAMLLAFVLLASSFVFAFQSVHPVHASSQDWTKTGLTEVATGEGHCALASGRAYCWGWIAGAISPLVPVPLDKLSGFSILSGKTISYISSGPTGECAVADGKAYCWGGNSRGELGDGTFNYSPTPVAVDTSGVLAGKTVTKMSAGGWGTYYRTCAVADGKAYCWGDNSHGQLGDGTTTSSATPVAVDTSGVLAGKTVVDIDTDSWYTTCALTSDGTVYCWGQGIFGQLGDGSASDSSTPVAVDTTGALAGKTINSLGMGYNHSCVSTTDGGAYCWGYGNEGELGTGAYGGSTTPVAVDTSGVMAGKSIRSIGAGGYVSCAVATSGEAFCWGGESLSYGTLGDTVRTRQSNAPVQVDQSNLSPGETFLKTSVGGDICFSSSLNKVYCFGIEGGSHFLGNNSTEGSAIAVPALSLTPEFTSASPAGILVNQSGRTVTISGNYFLIGARVWFGAQEATVTGENNDTLTVTAPASSNVGPVDITITNPDGESVTVSNAFNYSLLTPQINSLTYTEATTLGGIRTYIQGNDFDNPTVTIGGNVATINYSGSTYIDVNVPPSSTEGFVDITVTNQNGQSTTLTNGFKYVKANILPNHYKKTFGGSGSGNGQFDWLEGVTTDDDGNVYVTDNGNSRVQVFDKDGNYLRQFGTAGSGNGEFDYPTAIKIGPDGNLYVLDTNNYRVQVFTKNGTYLRQFGSQGFGDGQFTYAEGMAINSQGSIYITQCGYNSNISEYVSSIKVFKADGTYDRQIGTQGTGDKQFDCSYAVAIDKKDNIYIADARNYRIQVLDKNDTFITKFGSAGRFGDRFDWIEDLTIDPSGNVLVVDSGNNRIQVFSNSGSYLGQIGSFGSSDGKFDWPNSIAVGQNGDLYVVDADNYRVQVFEGMPQVLEPTTHPITNTPTPTKPIKKATVGSSITAGDPQAVTAASVHIDNTETPLTGEPTIPKRPTFSGVAAPFAEVVVTVHSDPVVCKTTADAEGRWSCTLDRDLPAGSHRVTIELTNQDGTKTTLGPYEVEVKGGDTIDSNSPSVTDKNVPHASKKDKTKTLLAYLSIAAAIAIFSIVVVIVFKRRKAAKF